MILMPSNGCERDQDGERIDERVLSRQRCQFRNAVILPHVRLAHAPQFVGMVLMPVSMMLLRLQVAPHRVDAIPDAMATEYRSEQTRGVMCGDLCGASSATALRPQAGDQEVAVMLCDRRLILAQRRRDDLDQFAGSSHCRSAPIVPIQVTRLWGSGNAIRAVIE